MKGYEGILQIAGYTKKEGASLQFPDAIQEPDKAKLSVLAAELLMARVEIEQMNCAAVEQKQEITCISHQDSPHTIDSTGTLTLD